MLPPIPLLLLLVPAMGPVGPDVCPPWMACVKPFEASLEGNASAGAAAAPFGHASAGGSCVPPACAPGAAVGEDAYATSPLLVASGVAVANGSAGCSGTACVAAGGEGACFGVACAAVGAASASCASFYCLAASAWGDAEAHEDCVFTVTRACSFAVSGTGDARGPVAVSGTGNADGKVASVSGCRLAGACLRG